MKALAVAFAFLAGQAPATSLKVTYWPHGRGASPTVWTLRCAPAAGTHPLRGRACLALKAHAADLGPATKPCTLLALRGSPEAEISGTWAGRKIDRSYRVGCPGWTDLKLVLTGG
ncbi:MAG: SSI family serine proteinase inhibitor [Gaiellaceae bacterium]